jgi:hypothetical protein
MMPTFLGSIFQSAARPRGLDRLLGVQQRDVSATSRQAVLEDEPGDAALVEPLGDAVAFGADHQAAVAAARADDDGGTVGLVGQMHGEPCLGAGGKLPVALRGIAFPQRQDQGFGGDRGEDADQGKEVG